MISEHERAIRGAYYFFWRAEKNPPRASRTLPDAIPPALAEANLTQILRERECADANHYAEAM